MSKLYELVLYFVGIATGVYLQVGNWFFAGGSFIVWIFIVAANAHINKRKREAVAMDSKDVEVSR